MKVVTASYFKSISGRVDDLVYYVNGNNQYTRRYVVPRNPDTEAQKQRRELFASAVILWQNLPLYKKEQWNARAHHWAMSGYNLFISRRLRQKEDHVLLSEWFAFISFFLFSLSVLGSSWPCLRFNVNIPIGSGSFSPG